MKITSVRPIIHSAFPNIMHIEIGTDSGLIGIGETYYFGSTVAHFVQEFIAPTILGLNPLDRELISRLLTTYVGHNGSGVETRARSAVDIALWDLAGKESNTPLWKLMGGTEERSVQIYNTCAGRGYMRTSDQSSKSWGVNGNDLELEDLHAFMTDAGGLAVELLEEGVQAMKIWPFDLFAEKNFGVEISKDDIELGLKSIRSIRERVGNEIEIMVELHALWSPNAALEIMSALKEFNIYWVEDPIYPDLVDEISILRKNGMPRIAHGETIASRSRVKQLVQKNLIDILTLDLSWCGGITEGLKFAEIARSGGIRIAPHDCTGPIGLTAGAHLSIADKNALIQETVRAAYRTWYPFVASGLPTIASGQLRLSDRPGLGVALNEVFIEEAMSLGTDALK